MPESSQGFIQNDFKLMKDIRISYLWTFMEVIFRYFRTYLRRCRNLDTGPDVSPIHSKEFIITPRYMLSFAWQISQGMSYLARMKVSITLLRLIAFWSSLIQLDFDPSTY